MHHAIGILNVAEEEPVHWVLTTRVDVITAVSQEKVQWYIYRWRIEQFHYILRTGAFNIGKLLLIE